MEIMFGRKTWKFKHEHFFENGKKTVCLKNFEIDKTCFNSRTFAARQLVVSLILHSIIYTGAYDEKYVQSL